MSKKRKAVKTGVRNAAKETARRRRRVTPAQARRLAARHVLAEMFACAPVRDGDAVRWHAYNVRRNDVWLVFPKVYRDPAEISSSQVVIVCKRTGRVLYVGSAGDEG